MPEFPNMNIFTLNPGSSSFKYALYELKKGDSSAEVLIGKGSLEQDRKEAGADGGENYSENLKSSSYRSIGEAVKIAVSLLQTDRSEKLKIDAIGCRVVHGGADFLEPTLISEETLARLEALNEFAPLHNPIALETIRTVRELLPDTPCVAVFDTAFHRTLPPKAATYGLPFDLCEKEGLKRYGFHGISYRYVSERLFAHTGRNPVASRIIACHLGSGSSVCALKDGESVDTSMGFTPTEGLLMGTRSGDIDPGLILHLLRKQGMTLDRMETILNHESGLFGVSGVSSDVREIEAAALSGNARAEAALSLFAYRVVKTIGSYAAVLGGVDSLLFTGGIGEHSGSMRMRICDDLALLGVELNSNQKTTGESPQLISSPASKTEVWVVPTNEELQIAREVSSVVRTVIKRIE